VKKKLLSLRLIFLTLLSSCNFEEENSVVTYTFFVYAPQGIEVITDEIIQYFYPDTNLKMHFDADLLTTAELKIKPSELNSKLLEITNEHNIHEWEVQCINDGFVFEGNGFS